MQDGKEKLQITIHTNLLEVKFFWNKKSVMSQIILLFILVLMHRIGFTQAIKRFCILGIMIDIGFIIVMFLPGFYVSADMVVPGSEDANKNTAPTIKAPTEQVNINHGEDNKASVVKEVDATISNTVGGSVSAPHAQQSSTPAPAGAVMDESEPDFNNLSSMFESFNETQSSAATEQASQAEEADFDEGGIFDLFSNF